MKYSHFFASIEGPWPPDHPDIVHVHVYVDGSHGLKGEHNVTAAAWVVEADSCPKEGHNDLRTKL